MDTSPAFFTLCPQKPCVGAELQRSSKPLAFEQHLGNTDKARWTCKALSLIMVSLTATSFLAHCSNCFSTDHSVTIRKKLSAITGAYQLQTTNRVVKDKYRVALRGALTWCRYTPAFICVLFFSKPIIIGMLFFKIQCFHKNIQELCPTPLIFNQDARTAFEGCLWERGGKWRRW